MGWIAGLLLKNRSAALRHTMRLCVLGAALLLPVLSYFLPAWQLPGLPQFQRTENQSVETVETPAEPALVSESRSIEPISRVTSAGAKTTTANYQLAPRIVANWPQVLMLIWILGIGLVVLRLVMGRVRFASLIGRAAAVDAPWWHSHVYEIAQRLGIRRCVALLASQETEIPLTSGAWRPKIVLSPDYAEWSTLRRDAILHHELAHIRRLDAVAQALCHAATAMYWFHPLVWLTVKAMRAEREQACDDYVLAAGTKPSEYAHELLEIASSLRQPAFISALAMARRSELEGRVMALLNPAQRRGSISQFATLITVLLTMCVVLPLAAIQTAAPQQKKSKPRPEVKTKPAPSAASVTDEQPPTPPAPVAPPPPPVPVGGIPGGVEGGVPGGVPGGVSGGVQDIPPLPAEPALPPPPPPLQAAPPAPAAPTAPAMVVPQVAPRPKVVPVPHTAPVAPAKPTAAVSPTTDSDAPKAAALAAVRARLVAIHAQEAVEQAETMALRAKIQANASTAALAKAPEIARIRAEKRAIAAVTVAKAGEIAALRTKVAAAATKAQAASTAPEVAALREQIAALPKVASGFTGDTTCAANGGHAGEKTITRQENREHWTVNWTKQCRVDLRSEGKVVFNESGAVENISPGGYLELTEVNGDTRRQVKVTPSPDGLKFVFRNNGAEQPFDDNAKAWFSSALNRLRWTTFAKVRIRMKSQ
jgi:beta-lactamase regulating signal transducer with metallopeptidase domain